MQPLADSPAERQALDQLIPNLTATLRDAASPDRALVNLERFLQSVAPPGNVIAQLAADPHMLEMLITLFAGSQYLTEILLRNPGYSAFLTERTNIAQIKGAGTLLAEARTATDPWLTQGFAADVYPVALDALRHFQQRELLRVGLADLCGLIELSSVTSQLSHLADSIIQISLELVAAQLNSSPAKPAVQGSTPAGPSVRDMSRAPRSPGFAGNGIGGFAVLAMGKLGGRELNYSSDVDLLFLVQESSDESQARVYRRLGERLIDALTHVTAAGFLYRVDMRLRPWGSVAPLITTADGYLAYLEHGARLWEKQALLRARVVAGDADAGEAFLSQAQPLLFGAGPDTVRAEVHAMRERTEFQLRQSGRLWGEVKLGEGSIRDVEFVTQYLQLAHGQANPELRTGNTLEALDRLSVAGFLGPDEYRILSDGYTFLRSVEHSLQILNYRQTHTLPPIDNPADLRYLAQRLGFQGPDAGFRFVMRYQQHTAAVRAVYLSHLSNGPRVGTSAGRAQFEEFPAAEMAAPFDLTQLEMTSADQLTEAGVPAEMATTVHQHLQRLSPSYAATFDMAEIARHAEMASHLDGSNPVAMEALHSADDLWRLTIVAYDALGELSLICGLLFAHGFSILDGHVYTYEPLPKRDSRRKIVDIFTVRPVGRTSAEPVTPDIWDGYATELTALLQHALTGQLRVAQGELAKRVASALRADPPDAPTLPPVDIEIDNDASARYTVLHIRAADTPGFLYEFTNALALNNVHIAQVRVVSSSNRIQDTLLVTDARGDKITASERQRELRAAAVLVKHFTHLLPRSPNPESALLHFNEVLGQLFARPSWPDELASLEQPQVLDALARLLGVSEFLWDDFLRMQYANLFPVVRDVDALSSGKDRRTLAAELNRALSTVDERDAWREALNAFKDREMFRIDMRHILGHIPEFARFAAELTDLAEVILSATVRCCAEELSAQHGQPLHEDGAPARLCLCALGKCGGRELGFASDIELMFVYDGIGHTSGPQVIESPAYFEKLVVEVVRAIQARREGIFEVDLQLRPFGSAGSLAVSLDSFRRYFAPNGSAWSYERQALVKLRPIAGDAGLGEQIAALRDAYVYEGAPFDVPAMRAMRERQLRHLVTPGTVNAKFSKGGLVDLEYIVQGLQIAHGQAHPAVRVCNTADAIEALAAAGIISAENGARLQGALVFLQRLINALRMVRGNNKDLTVPTPGSEEFDFLARRLSYDREPTRLKTTMDEHMTRVQQLGTRLLG